MSCNTLFVTMQMQGLYLQYGSNIIQGFFEGLARFTKSSDDKGEQINMYIDDWL